MSGNFTLPSGRYFISSKLAEESSIGLAQPGPWGGPVILLPEGVQASKWVLTATRDGQLIISLDNNVTKVSVDVLVTTGDDAPEEWIVNPIPQHGRDVYTIENVDRSAGWVLEEDNDLTKVNVKPLVVGRSRPPFYPDFELWKITPA